MIGVDEKVIIVIIIIMIKEIEKLLDEKLI